MAYKKLNLNDGDVLMAEHIAHIEEGISTAEAKEGRSVALNLLDNSCFLPQHVVNQRAADSINGAKYSIDRWKGTTSTSTHGVSEKGLVITHSGTGSGYCGVQQILPDNLAAAIEGKTVTVAVCMEDGTVYIRSGIPVNGAVSANFGNGFAQTYINNGLFSVRIMHNTSGASVTVRWVALYDGEYTAETLPTYQPKGYSSELLACQRYYHVYGTSAERPSHGKDCVPHMVADAPSQGTITIDETTFYYNSADL